MAAATAAAWAAWPEPTVGHAAVSQFHVIATVLLLAGLPLLARRFFGPVSRSRAGRSLRVFCCAAVLAFIPALAIVEAFTNLTPARPAYKYVFCIAQGWSDASQGCGGVPGRSTGGPPWPGEIVLLLLTAGYVGVILFLTSRRSRVTRGTLVIGIGAGLLFGVVMYVVAPLGLNNYATDPWLPGSRVDPLVVLAWILLFGGPAVVAVSASRRCRELDGVKPSYGVRVGQGIAAGVLVTGTGALFVTALGTSTTAMLLRSTWLRHWLYHGHLSATRHVPPRDLRGQQRDRVRPHPDGLPGHRPDHERGKRCRHHARPPRIGAQNQAPTRSPSLERSCTRARRGVRGGR